MKKRGKSKAQISMEFLLVIGFAFLMTIPLIVIFYQQSESLTTDITASQIDKVASEIRDAADEVYYLGPPSKKTITVYFPEGIKQVNITNNTITFVVSSSGGNFDLVKWAATNLTGTLKTHKGIHQVTVEAQNTAVDING